MGLIAYYFKWLGEFESIFKLFSNSNSLKFMYLFTNIYFFAVSLKV